MQISHFDSFLIFRKFLVFPNQTVTNASSRQHIFKRPVKSRIVDIDDILQFRKTITETTFTRYYNYRNLGCNLGTYLSRINPATTTHF